MSCSGLYLNWYRPNAPQPTAGPDPLRITCTRYVCSQTISILDQKKPISIHDTKKKLLL